MSHDTSETKAASVTPNAATPDEAPTRAGAETPVDAPISMTAKAADAIRARASREGAEGLTLRLSVLGGGCSGVSYKMDFDAQAPRPGDIAFVQHGISVAIDPKSLRFLFGSELDYKVELMSQRFVWSNPNAKSSCGCGESFGV